MEISDYIGTLKLSKYTVQLHHDNNTHIISNSLRSWNQRSAPFIVGCLQLQLWMNTIYAQNSVLCVCVWLRANRCWWAASLTLDRAAHVPAIPQYHFRRFILYSGKQSRATTARQSTRTRSAEQWHNRIQGTEIAFLLRAVYENDWSFNATLCQAICAHFSAGTLEHSMYTSILCFCGRDARICGWVIAILARLLNQRYWVCVRIYGVRYLASGILIWMMHVGKRFCFCVTARPQERGRYMVAFGAYNRFDCDRAGN